MKEFIIKSIAFAAFCVFLVLGLCVGIDPYSVFHPFAIKDNGIEADKNYVKMRYILANPDRFDAFIFGSSRVGAIFPERMEKLSCYNMTYSMGLPQDHYRNIQTMIENGVKPKKIFIGVDSLSYTMDPALHDTILYQYPYEKSQEDKYHFWKPFFKSSMVVDSLHTSLPHKKEKDFSSDFYEFGCWKSGYKKPKSLDYLKEGASIGTDDFKKDVLNTIAKIRDLCDENGIELVVFTNPMHHLTFDASVDADWYVFAKELAKRTDYYNFAGLNKITLDDYNYNDTSHYYAGVGDLMIARMEDDEDTQAKYGDSFGFAVTKDNVDQLIEIWGKESAKAR